MCQFIIRPITSYATIDVMASKVVADTIPTTFENLVLKTDTAFEVKRVDSGYVYGVVKDVEGEVAINLSDFVHTFTANPEDVKKVKEAQAKSLFSKPTAEKK